MRCLIVDDDPVCRKVLCAALRAYGTAEEATSTGEAIEAVRRALVDQRPFRLITLDMMTPDMDCRSVLMAIRGLSNEPANLRGSFTKIFICMSLSSARSIPAMDREHCDGYLTKPIDLERMFVLLKAHGLIPA